jgi:hypothetical protein
MSSTVTGTPAAPAQATIHEDTSGAHALAMFLATFAAGYVPKIDPRTPADLGLDPV